MAKGVLNPDAITWEESRASHLVEDAIRSMPKTYVILLVERKPRLLSQGKNRSSLLVVKSRNTTNERNRNDGG
eukprot:4978061-Ditylum_brightwellii.AAC.1